MEKTDSWLQRLQTRLALGFAALVILSSSLILFVLYLTVQQQLREDVRDKLYNAVSIAALQVDGSVHSSLTEPEQEDSQAYLQIKKVLQQIRDASTDVYFAYTLRQDEEGQILFVVDAATDPNEMSHLGDVYDDASELLASNFATMNQTMVEEEFYTDQWGTWLSGYAPFYDQEGKRAGILAMDIDAQRVRDKERQFLNIALIIFAFVTPAATIGGWLMGRSMAEPVEKLTEGASRIASGDFKYRVKVESSGEIRKLAGAFNTMAAQLQNLVEGLEKRVKERTRDVEQRSRYLEAAAEVSHTISSILDTEQLVREVVKVIRERFGLYYVGLFIGDSANEWAILKAGTGEAGEKMVRRQHRIKVGEGMVGWSISNAKARVAMDIGQDRVRLSTAELPFTRSEAAIPLRSRGRVLGALTVQSDQEGVFDDATVAVLQTMADQVATALENARLFSASQEALERARRAYGELSKAAWDQVLEQRTSMGYRCDAEGVTLLSTEHIDHDPNGSHHISEIKLPLKIRGQNIGVVIAHKPSDDGEWLPEEMELLGTLTEQLNVALENARLYADTQRRAERERLISEITSKLRASTNLDVVLQTAVRELAQALHIQRGAIQLVSRDGGQSNE